MDVGATWMRRRRRGESGVSGPAELQQRCRTSEAYVTASTLNAESLCAAAASISQVRSTHSRFADLAINEPICGSEITRCWNQPSPDLHATRRIRLGITKLIILGTATWGFNLLYLDCINEPRYQNLRSKHSIVAGGRWQAIGARKAAAAAR